MKRERLLALALGLLLGVFAGFSVLASGFDLLQDVSLREEVLRSPVRDTQGTVTLKRHHTYRDRHDAPMTTNYYLAYEFTAPHQGDVRPFFREVMVSEAVYRAHQEKGPVTVRFVADNPAISDLPGNRHQNGWAVFLGLIGLVLLLPGYLAFKSALGGSLVAALAMWGSFLAGPGVLLLAALFR